MNSRPVIDVKRVNKRYVKYEDAPLLLSVLQPWGRSQRGELWALRDISFTVNAGETVGVIGQNGSGKSTLLRLLGGVTAPSSGRVRVSGRIAPLISVGVGFNPELTGRENVYVNGTILGLSRREIDARFDEIVDFAEVEDFIDTPVKFYSSGMFVRLGFAVAVRADPKVLLVDEVLAVGDAGFQIKCLQHLDEIRKRGTTVFLVSHNLNAVRNLCARTIVLQHGEMHHDGNTNDAISLYHDLLEKAGGESHVDDTDEWVARLERLDLLGPDGKPTGHVDHTDEVTLELEVTFLRTTDDVILGVGVLNQSGALVYGDSTPWTGMGRFKAGQTVRFEVRFRPDLASGSYAAQVALRNLSAAPLFPAPRPLLFYVGGRPLVMGATDLHAEFVAHRDGRAVTVTRKDPERGSVA